MAAAAEPHPALKDAHARYTLRNPASQEAYKDGCTYLAGGNTRSVLHASPFPLTFISGHGSTLTSLDGDTYTDFLGEYSAGIFGHSNGRIAETVAATMTHGWNFGGLTTHEKRLAHGVSQRFGLDRVRFTNSGTEANTMALAAALAFVQARSGTATKKKVLVFSNAYHGGTLAFPMKLIKETRRRRLEEMGRRGAGDEEGAATPLPTTNLPHDFVFAPYNNVDETISIVDGLLSSGTTSSLAAILVEPVQGSGGCRPASIEFLKYLREVADIHSALLIADEVMTSRLAFGGICMERTGIRPDLMTLGKWIGGGMSFGAFGGRRDVMEQFNPVSGTLSHAGTFNNNVLSMAAGNVGLEICTQERLRDLSSLGVSLKQGIWRVLSEYGLLRDDDGDAAEIDTFDETASDVVSQGRPRMFVTGYGSLVNVRFQGRDADVWQSLFFHHMLEENIYLSARGYMALTLELTQKDVTNFVDVVEKFVSRYSTELETWK